MRIEIYGHSDDSICWRINGGRASGGSCDSVGGYISGDGYYSRTLTLSTVGGARGVKVHAIYDGCWSFAVGQLEDGRSIPADWKISVGQEHEYSTRLTIEGDDLASISTEPAP